MDFYVFGVLLILCCGIVLGFDIALLTTINVSKISALCRIVVMLLVVNSVLVSSMIKESKK